MSSSSENTRSKLSGCFGCLGLFTVVMVLTTITYSFRFYQMFIAIKEQSSLVKEAQQLRSSLKEGKCQEFLEISESSISLSNEEKSNLLSLCNLMSKEYSKVKQIQSVGFNCSSITRTLGQQDNLCSLRSLLILDNGKSISETFIWRRCLQFSCFAKVYRRSRSIFEGNKYILSEIVWEPISNRR